VVRGSFCPALESLADKILADLSSARAAALSDSQLQVVVTVSITPCISPTLQT
jgi:hypothetical protein